MCFLKPLKVKKVMKKYVVLENNIHAYVDPHLGLIQPNDTVVVYGNVVLQKTYDA